MERGVHDKSAGSWAAGRSGSGPEGRFTPQISTTAPQPGDEHGAARGPLPDDALPQDLVFIVKRDGTILYVNRSFPRSAGRSLLGTSIYEYTAPAQQAALRSSLEVAFSSARTDGFECTGTEPFVEGAWYQCRVVPNLREGVVVSATIVARDVTRWKTAEDELRGEQQRVRQDLARLEAELEQIRADAEVRGERETELSRFRDIIDQAGEAIFITDPETGRFVDVNETACQWVGYRREKLLQMGIRDLDVEFPLESPDGVAEHVTDTRGYHRPRVYSDGLHRRRNGTSFPVEVAIARRRFGNHEYMLVVARDIKKRRVTEQALRESEDKYRSLFDLSRDAIYLSARDGSIAEVNDAAIDIFGYTRAEFLTMEARKLYGKSEEIRAFQRGVNQSGCVRDMEVEFVRNDGSRFRGMLTATLRHDGDGGVLGYQCLIRPCENGKPAVIRGGTTRLPPTKKQLVLVIDPDKHVLEEVRAVLERVEISAVTARTVAACLEVLRTQAGEVGLVLLGCGPKESFGDSMAAIRGASPSTPVALMGGADQSYEGIPDDEELAVIRKPLHPLALVQHVRERLNLL